MAVADITEQRVGAWRKSRLDAGLARHLLGAPKSAAGNRFVVPEVIIAALQLHPRWLAQPGEDGLLFTSPEGRTLRYDDFRHRVWYPALAAAGLPRVHFHGLRHTGNQLARPTGPGTCGLGTVSVGTQPVRDRPMVRATSGDIFEMVGNCPVPYIGVAASGDPSWIGS